MKIRQMAQTLFTYSRIIVLSEMVFMLALSSLPVDAQQPDCSQPAQGMCSIMVTNQSGTVTYADSYYGPNYSLNRTYTGETYWFDVMPSFGTPNSPYFWPNSDWGDCDEVGASYSANPSSGVTITMLSGNPPMYADITFSSPGGFWTVNAAHNGWTCSAGQCGTTVNGCYTSIQVSLSPQGSPTYTPTPTMMPPTPTPTVTPTPTRTPTITPTSIPTPQLELTYYSPNDLYISDTPQMPNSTQTQCRARLLNYNGGQVTFTWTYTVSFSSDNGVIGDCFSGTSTAMNSNETSWSPDFGSIFVGGDVSISVSALNATYIINRNNAYKIKGTNPTQDSVKTEIGTSPWFYQRIMRQESQYRQYDSNGMPLPNSGHDGGYGIAQITPPDNINQYWNWRTNVQRGKEVLQGKRNYAESKVTQQIEDRAAYNAIHDPDIGDPTATTYSDITFKFNPGSGESPYQDAIAIKYYNGLGSASCGSARNFLVWYDIGQDPDPGQGASAHWRIIPFAYLPTSCAEQYYVRDVCELQP